MTSALAGTRIPLPTSAIFPFSITTVPLAIVPCVMVRMVAPLITTGRPEAPSFCVAASVAQIALPDASQAHHRKRIVKKRMLFTVGSREGGKLYQTHRSAIFLHVQSPLPLASRRENDYLL